ncbi:MAG: hypothetical protein JWQ35_1220 [Bacteriovoracaceae bacterium]|nr:hypothetical protein [Bacteriovoracaceae bacterium]
MVIPGTQSRIKNIHVAGLPEGSSIKISHKRFLIGKILTPKKLDEITGWLRSELQNRGYGCPLIDLKADESGEINIKVTPGPIHLITEIERPKSISINPFIFGRYEAFHLGNALDNRLLTLSSSRILRDDLFLSSYYDLACDKSQSLRIVQRVVAVKPRLIALGLGIDTEALLKARALWKHSRLDSKASSLQVQLDASFLQQSGETFMEWYPLESGSRFHLIPRLRGIRYSEKQFEALSAEASVLATTNYDASAFNLDVSYGPAYEFVDTRKGEGPKNSRYLSFKGQLRVMSHLFEYYLSNPQTGWNLTFNSYSRFKGIYSSATFHRFSLNSEVLWNLSDYYPPYAVFGWRMSTGTFWIPDGSFQFSVPPQLRFFLGGDRDVHGFSRNELPPNGIGFHTFLYEGFELRSGDFFYFDIQPLIFFDIAWGGEKFLKIANSTYASPGIGARWSTRFGVFRGTAAHGFIWGKSDLNTHWEFFLSYGQEF